MNYTRWHTSQITFSTKKGGKMIAWTIHNPRLFNWIAKAVKCPWLRPMYPLQKLNETHIGKIQTSITPDRNDVGFLETELYDTPSNSILWMVHYHREPAFIWTNRSSTMIASSLQNSLRWENTSSLCIYPGFSRDIRKNLLKNPWNWNLD